MDTVLYSASPLRAFLTSFGTMGFIFVLGLVGIGSAAYQRNQRLMGRLGIALAGAFLLIVSVWMGLVTWRSFTAGTHTVAGRLDHKVVSEENCENGAACTRYVLELVAGQKAYDVNVAPAAYEKAELQGCYRFTYYPSNGFIVAPQSTGLYEPVRNLTRLEAAPDTACP